MSFISLRLAAPSLLSKSIEPVVDNAQKDQYTPFVPSIVLYELVEIRHKFVYRLAHVHVPDLGPNRISIRQRSCLVLIGTDRRLEFIPVEFSIKSIAKVTHERKKGTPQTCIWYRLR
jgi:hypothetical protein